MTDLAYDFALGYVAVVALGRVFGIFVLKLRRQGQYEERAVAVPRSWRDRCTAPEPWLLGIVTLVLALRHDAPAPADGVAIARVSAAALLAFVAMVLMLWVLRSFPTVSTGHYVLPDQEVVTDGPYGLVRHPLYLAAWLVWLAVALAYASGLALGLTLAYVIPSYWVYMRAEEEMLVANLGPPYRRYRERVGMLFPRLRRSG